MKRNIFLWCLYDFANSVVMIVFLFYFSQWLTIDNAKPDWWFNVALVVTSFLFIFTAPVVGHWIDRGGRKIGGLRIMTALSIIGFLKTALITLFFPSMVLLAVIVYTVSMYFYLLSFVYYTPMIQDFSSAANRGTIAGIGQAANSFGQIMGLVFALPFANGLIHLPGADGRAQTLLPAVVIFALFALPILIWYKEEKVAVRPKFNIKESYTKLFSITRQIFSVRNLALLLIGYFLFSDALLTFSNNFPIFLEKVHGVSDNIKTALTAGILLLAILGALIFGRIADKKGTKRTLIWILVANGVLLSVIAFASSFVVLVIACLAAGFLYGPVWAVSKAMIVEYSPQGLTASTFSFYIVAERFATFLGPLLWSATLFATKSSGTLAYSYAIMSSVLLVVVSVFFIRKIRVV